MHDYINELKKNTERPVISTGFSRFNEKLGGGIVPGLYILGAVSSLGKTAFVLQMADNMAANQHNVLYISLEMSKLELVSRSISNHMFLVNRDKCKKVGTLTVMNGHFSNYLEEMNQAMKNYEKTGQYLTIQKCSFNTTVEELRMKVKSYIQKTGKKPVLIVDYLQVLKTEGFTDKQVIDNIVYGLKNISETFSIPVIAISSFNRTGYMTPVSFECFKESGSIEFTADVVIGMQLSILNDSDLADNKKSKLKEQLSKEKSAIPRKITAVILKNRNSYSHATQDFLFYPVNNYIQEV
jgi:replicative DNA helicase